MLAAAHHGKSKVRLGRVWRNANGVHDFVEYQVDTMLETDPEQNQIWFVQGDNKDMTATDTQKNTVYYIAKQFDRPCSPEEFALALAKHFVKEYPKVTKAKVSVEMKPWKRITTADGKPHSHGYEMAGTETRTAVVEYDDRNKFEITAGCKNLCVLKTTQSGYVGYLMDKFTMLPETTDRIMATNVTSTWKYSRVPANFDRTFEAVKKAFSEMFYGSAEKGVYSPSVQYTIYEMGVNVVRKVPEVESIFFNLPNLHFIPCNPAGTSGFADDVYVATGEPHGNIEAVITRAHAMPHARL